LVARPPAPPAPRAADTRPAAPPATSPSAPTQRIGDQELLNKINDASRR
jgi:hypothetical protein